MRRLKKTLKIFAVFLTICSIIVLTALISKNELQTDYSIISTETQLFELVQYKNPAQLFVDLRDAKDYENGHIEGFVNIPSKTGEEVDQYIISHNNMKKTIYLMCYSGKRSAEVFNYLSQNGYKKIVCIIVGYDSFAANTDGFVPSTGPCNCLDE